MKYVDNAIVFEVGDWVVQIDSFSEFPKDFKAHQIKSISEGSGRFCLDGNPRFSFVSSQFRPAAQSEIDTAAKDKEILVGEHKVTFQSDGIKVGCTPVSKELFLKIGKKAGWC